MTEEADRQGPDDRPVPNPHGLFHCFNVPDGLMHQLPNILDCAPKFGPSTTGTWSALSKCGSPYHCIFMLRINLSGWGGSP